MNPSIKEILVEYLQANGYDGLAGAHCGCTIDDLGDCEYPNLIDCHAGYLIPEANQPEDCPAKGLNCMGLKKDTVCDGKDCPL